MKFECRYEIIKTAELFNLYRKQKLEFNPEFQREFVWPRDFKGYLIISLLKNYPIGSITLWFNKVTGKYEVVDGQQRLKTFFYFVEGKKGEFNSLTNDRHLREYRKTLKHDWENGDLDIASNDRTTFARFNEQKSVSFATLPKKYQERITKTTHLLISYIDTDNRTSVAEYFSYIQNQDRLRAGEIIAAFPSSQFDYFLKPLKKIFKIISKERLKFSDKRKEYIKLFVNIVGLEEEQLELGCSDAKVRDFFDKNKDELTLSAQTQTKIDNCIKFFKKIIELKTLNFKIKSWKRYFKLLLILFFVCNYDFEPNLEQQLQKLAEINEHLATHASTTLTEAGKKREVKRFYKNSQYWNYGCDVDLFSIAKDQQNKEKVKRICKKLVVYLKSLFVFDSKFQNDRYLG